MFGPIIFFAALLTAPAPSAQPSAAPALKTIASVRSTARCAEIITHANSAITTTLDDDAVLAKTITMLHFVDLDDGNAIHRRNRFNEIGDLAKTLMLQSRSGDNEVKRLRALAKTAKDPAQAKDLKDFADELGGALWRQQKVARDLNGYLAYEDYRDMATLDESQRKANEGVFGVADPMQQTPTVNPGARGPVVGYGPDTGQPAIDTPRGLLPHANDPTATDYARAAADDFARRIPDIVLDENHAASHIDGALAGCQP
ncbi:MAG TPA: hypothetical protein VFE17_09595 [Candidatus Baltobacteraceae bacterium]|jgi:hypothetical protein|nr:hypothetical protein [Candidatus Baltobacteraceae bacterium]